MAAKHINKPPVTSRGPTGKHATKSKDELQQYKDHVKSAASAGATVEHPPPGSEGMSAPPDISGPAMSVGEGDIIQISLPAPVSVSPSSKIMSNVWGIVGVAGFLALIGAFIHYGILTQSVNNNTQKVNELGGKQEKARDRMDGIAERVTSLEVKVDNAVKSGASTAAIASEVASLRRALEAQDAQDGLLARRIEAVEARLASISTEPSNP